MEYVVMSATDQYSVAYGACKVGGMVGDFFHPVGRDSSVSVSVLALVTSEEQAGVIVHTLRSSSELASAWMRFTSNYYLDASHEAYIALRDRLVQEASAA